MRYFIRARFHASGREFVTSFDSALVRALYLLSIEPYARIEGEWTE